MIKELQNRLTLLYTLTTGIILTLVVIAISIISQLNLLKQAEEEFQSHIMNISMKLQTELYFNVSWMASMEADNGLIIHIEENGKPLLYQGSWNPPSSRDKLISQAKAQAVILGTDISLRPVSSASISPIFTLRGGQKDEYQCIAMAYPTKTGYKSLVLLYYISPALETLRVQRLLFSAAAVLGIAALFLAARKFVKRATKPIEISSQKQREFVAAASHELRSPLMVIQSSAQAIETVPEKTLQFTQNICHECTRMGRLIDDLLLLASLETQNWPIDFDILDPNVLLLDFYELYEPLCLDQKVPLQLQLPEDLLPGIKGDSTRILQVLTILMNNALSYNIEKRPILLEAASTKSHIYFKVIDHGPGIAEEQKKLIFERFYRIDSSRKDKQHFGLGLSIAQELAALHKGSILVTDTPGGGCTFILKLPAVYNPAGGIIGTY